MRIRIVALFMAVLVLPFCLGCGGGGYKDRVGNTELDPDAAPVGPGEPGEEQ